MVLHYAWDNYVHMFGTSGLETQEERRWLSEFCRLQFHLEMNGFMKRVG